MKTITTWLPNFPGFYESILSGQIDREMDMAIEMLQEENEGMEWDEAYEKFEKDFDYRKAQLAVAQGYMEVWAETFEIPNMKFESIDSPREYNFTTDRLGIQVPEDFMMQLRERCMVGDLTDEFDEVLKKNFTSYDGFMSFYSNDASDEEWQNLENWDMNQWMCVLEAHMNFTGEEVEYDDHRIYEAAQEGWIR